MKEQGEGMSNTYPSWSFLFLKYHVLILANAFGVAVSYPHCEHSSPGTHLSAPSFFVSLFSKANAAFAPTSNEHLHPPALAVPLQQGRGGRLRRGSRATPLMCQFSGKPMSKQLECAMTYGGCKRFEVIRH